jgi:hypothetical protein
MVRAGCYLWFCSYCRSAGVWSMTPPVKPLERGFSPSARDALPGYNKLKGDKNG